MINFLDVINIVGILGTSVISTITLFTTRALQRSQQKASVMANKRSERIDLLRIFRRNNQLREAIHLRSCHSGNENESDFIYRQIQFPAPICLRSRRRAYR